MSMSIEEIKRVIVLDDHEVPYDEKFKEKVMRAKMEILPLWIQMYGNDKYIIINEFENRGYGKTTDIMIEALHNMSLNKSVHIKTSDYYQQQYVLDTLLKYSKQLGICFLYNTQEKFSDIVLEDFNTFSC